MAERELADELAGLDRALTAQLTAAGFDPQRLLRWAGRIDGGSERNRVTGVVEPPAPADLAAPPAAGSKEAETLAGDGLRALAAGGLPWWCWQEAWRRAWAVW